MSSFISFIPTLAKDTDRFFELAPVSLTDVVYDLGSGDGRLLFAALEKGAGRAVGVDLDVELIHTARRTAKDRGVEDRITFLVDDVMDVNLADATLVFCYLCSQASEVLKPKFEAELKPSTRVVMETFPVPGWKPVQAIKKDYRHFYLYVMPPEFID